MTKIDLEELYIENQTALRTICHDLANPLSVILSASSLCLEVANAEAKPFVEKIYFAALEQKRLLRSLKSLKKFLAAKGRPQLEEVDIDDATARAVESFKSLLNRKNLTIEVRIEHNEDSILLAEPESFQQIVLNNLLSNAINFSHKNSNIILESRKVGDMVRLRVIDRGIGIPDTALAKIFEFNNGLYRIGTMNERGVGLGMPLLGMYVKKCLGSIEIESKDIEQYPGDHGTTVTAYFHASTP